MLSGQRVIQIMEATVAIAALLDERPNYLSLRARSLMAGAFVPVDAQMRPVMLRARGNEAPTHSIGQKSGPPDAGSQPGAVPSSQPGTWQPCMSSAILT